MQLHVQKDRSRHRQDGRSRTPDSDTVAENWPPAARSLSLMEPPDICLDALAALLPLPSARTMDCVRLGPTHRRVHLR
jgi:hypothetical protein